MTPDFIILVLLCKIFTTNRALQCLIAEFLRVRQLIVHCGQVAFVYM